MPARAARFSRLAVLMPWVQDSCVACSQLQVLPSFFDACVKVSDGPPIDAIEYETDEIGKLSEGIAEMQQEVIELEEYGAGGKRPL